ncbi:hypothetical protein FB460_2438 [Propioniferax innocua]|uniref:Uncharacterized protein n=1 Tax=Propioniferax innocua TaxID=1753 RepID=A0A542Z889_9ACTN|nr:hypothetical protein FB460_2438 [Propioniferax innocua]
MSTTDQSIAGEGMALGLHPSAKNPVGGCGHLRLHA